MPKGILVINLDQRADRLERFRIAAATHGCLAGWQRLPAINGQQISGFGRPPWFCDRKRDKHWAGRAGCALSHRNAIAEARARHWESVLILEDDVEPAPDFSDRLSEALLQTNRRLPDWKVLYLGVSKPFGPARRLACLTDQRELCEIVGCLGAFAYIVKSECYDWLLTELPTEDNIWPWIARHRAVDRWYANNLHRRFRVAAIAPSMVHHYSSFSDIGLRSGATIATSAHETHDGKPIHTTTFAAFYAGRRLLKMRLWFVTYMDKLRSIRRIQCGF